MTTDLSLIQNVHIHTYQGLYVAPFGHSGAAYFTPIAGGKVEHTFILDVDSVVALRDRLNTIIQSAEDIV